MTVIRKDIEELRTYYRTLPWYQRWLFPSKLAGVLNDPASNTSQVYHAFNENVSFWSFPFLWGLWRFSSSMLFSNYKVVTRKPYWNVKNDKSWIKFLDNFGDDEALDKQKRLNQLTQEQVDKVIRFLERKSQYQPFFSKLATAYFDAIETAVESAEMYDNPLTSRGIDLSHNGHIYSERVAFIVVCIENAGITTDDELLSFLNEQLDSFWQREPARMLNILHEEGIIQGTDIQKKNIISTVLHNRQRPSLTHIVLLLKKNNLLNQNNFTFFLQDGAEWRLEVIKDIFDILSNEQKNLLSQEIFSRVLAHDNYSALHQVIRFFERTDGTPTIRAATIRAAYRAAITAEYEENAPTLLTDEENALVTLDLILRHTTLLRDIVQNITPTQLRSHWHRITPILQNPNLTPEQLNQALRDYVNFDILRRERGLPLNNTPAPINGHQSTHTASVHTTTDLTAWLLLEKHKKELEKHKKKKTDPINLLGLWPVIKHKFLQRKTQIEQKIQNLELSQTDSTEGQVEQLRGAHTILDALISTESKMKTAEDCLKRLTDVSCDIVLSVEKKQTALNYINESELKHDAVIQALLPGLIEQNGQESKLSLQQFIGWIYEEIEQNPSKPDYILGFIEALYEIQRGYYLDKKGQDDLKESHSICYGGTANKFPELLVGLSSLIHFVFITEATILANIGLMKSPKENNSNDENHEQNPDPIHSK